jgi:hypothetical protein
MKYIVAGLCFNNVKNDGVSLIYVEFEDQIRVSAGR